MKSRPARIAVLLSGRGSNFERLAEAAASGEVSGAIVLVVSDRPAAPGLEKARGRGIPARAVERWPGEKRVDHDSRVLAALAEFRPDWVCLAGYMRRLGPAFVRAYPRRILNIHPSLLPAFPGLDAQRQALEHGVRISGCTVHLVDEGVDTGPIVGQRSVPVLDSDDPETLAVRILEKEHELYPSCLQRLLSEEWSLQGRRVRFESKKIPSRP